MTIRRLPAHCALALLLCLPVMATAGAGEILFDTHAHLMRNAREGNPAILAREIVQRMDELSLALTILLPPPYPPGHGSTYGSTVLQGVVRDHPGRFAFVAGGESLNPLLQAADPASVGPELRERFQREALAIVQAGAVGFGEMTAEHFSMHPLHPYESCPPDHPLLLLLADLAAEHHMPVDLHMEALPRAMDFPGPRPGGANPPRVRENIAALERLLAHNRGAAIIWAHCGWDMSGERSPELMRGLLRRHPNLFMSIKLDHKGPRRNSPLDTDNVLRPEWLAFFREFPDRFIFGSDQFHDDAQPRRLRQSRLLLDQLPAELAPAFARDNARRLYRRLPPAP